jgi:hypothetical protein
MFTDQPVTPTRLETLIDLLRNISNRKLDRKMLTELLQPEGLPDGLPKREQSRQTLKAAFDLRLIKEDEQERLISLTIERKDKRTTRQVVLEALDTLVLSDTQVEPYFALFFSYLLSLNAEGGVKKSGDEWARDFERDVQGGQRSENPFNNTKLTGLHRWMAYAGLGWYDPSEVLQPNPYDRLRRRLPAIFAGEKKLTGEAFMQRLAAECPELDGGGIFIQAHRRQAYDPAMKICTLGLSHALIDLHHDELIRLYCPRDSRGWSIEAAEPPADEGLQSVRIDTIELLKTN